MTHKDKVWFHLYQESKVVKFIKTESRMEVRSYYLMGTVSVWEDE